MRYAGPLLAGGGRLLAMKGRHPATSWRRRLNGWKVRRVHRLTVPGLDEERHLVELCRSHDKTDALTAILASMKRVIAVANQKGGVGKTTTTVNLAASLAATQRKVLLIDSDPQGNATMGCGIDKRQLRYSMTDVLLGDAEVAAALLPVDPGGFTLLPANQDLVAAEVQLFTKIGREMRLRNALKPVRGALRRAS